MSWIFFERKKKINVKTSIIFIMSPSGIISCNPNEAAPQCVLAYLLSERILPLSEWGLPPPEIPLPAGLPPSDRWPPSSSSSSSSRWPCSEPLCCSASEWSLSPGSECMLASDWFPDRSEWLSLPLCWLCWLCCSSSLSSPNSSY